jgi:ATP-dependent exoDNAse (exonuclease V) beta subunit
VENINLYKAGSYWCVPDLDGTPLGGVADGVYDVTLSRSSKDTLFAEDYVKESFLQQVDNINTIYVAMTRAALGMHLIAKIPSAKCLKAVEDGDVTEFADFSQILYWFASASSAGPDIPGNDELMKPFSVEHSTGDDGAVRFDVGEMVDFAAHRKSRTGEPSDFHITGEALPSIPLNPLPEDPSQDVRERGRLKFSADSLDFFSEEGQAGISASNRIRGVVLHDVLSRMRVAGDLKEAVRASVLSGELTAVEAEEVETLLAGQIAKVEDRGWFRDDDAVVLNETSLIDSDGQIYRPDRVMVRDGKVVIIDYKFGEHDPRYERQLKKYAGIWRRMGHEDVSAYLWYVHTGEIVFVI